MEEHVFKINMTLYRSKWNKFTIHDDASISVGFPDGRNISVLEGGYTEINYPDGRCISIDPNGGQIVKNPHGQDVFVSWDGLTNVTFPDGRDVWTYDYGLTSIEFPDGRNAVIDSSGNFEMRLAESPEDDATF